MAELKPIDRDGARGKLCAMTGPLGRLHSDWRREPAGAPRFAARATRFSGLRVWLVLLLLAGSLRAETAGARRYVIDVWQGEKGLPQNTVTGIAQTSDGYLWLTTLDGVARFDGVRCRSDGLPVLECEGGCQPAGCRSRDGRLWFPTIRGLVVVDPAGVSTNTIAPPVHIQF